MSLINLTKPLPGIAWAALAATLSAQTAAPSAGPAVLQIKADQVAARVSPRLYGLMTEEINFSYEGGLYAESVRNRTFMEDAKEPVHWTLVQEAGGSGSMALDPSRRFNATVSTSLKLTIGKASAKERVGIANEGFWGIPVWPKTSYRASFYAEAAPGFKGPLTVSIVSNDGATVHATAQVARIAETWQRYEVILTTRDAPVSTANRLMITSAKPGTLWLSTISLFPPTYNNRPNGNRNDMKFSHVVVGGLVGPIDRCWGMSLWDWSWCNSRCCRVCD